MTQGFALRGTLAMAALAALAGCASTDSGWATPSDTGLSADIRRTAFGIPHIRANDYASLGYGMAYAYAQDNVCLLADQVVTVNGERSKTFGPDGTVTVSFKPIPNPQSDAFFKGAFDEAGLRAGYAQMSPEARDLLRGYIAGYNRYLKDTPAADRPAACRNAAWVRPLTLADMMRMGEEKAIQASAGAMLQSIVAAQPPGAHRHLRSFHRMPSTPPRSTATSNCATCRSAPTAGPSARPPPTTAAACSSATRTFRGRPPTASTRCT